MPCDMNKEMSTPILRARGVGKTYSLGKRTLEILRGVDLEVFTGEFLALQGASGAGKSTLLHLLGGLDTPTLGEIWFQDRNLTSYSESHLARFRNLKIGFIFQAYHLLPELDALENVALPARMARVPAALAQQKAEQLLTRAGLAERLDHRPMELSGGEQQRVAIARALVNDPELILADEPTGNLDSHTGGEIMDLLESLRHEHRTTLVMATHDGKIAERAPRIIHLVDGQIRVNV
jgi:lipoprotein-releasing system ATP-binding protein